MNQISVSKESAKLQTSRGPHRLLLAQFTKLYRVTHEDTLFHGDEPFWIFEFGQTAWVVPEFTSGIDELVKALKPTLSERGVFEVRTPPIPFSWRQKLLGVLPLFPIPRLIEVSAKSYPDWAVTGPLPFSTVQKFFREIS